MSTIGDPLDIVFETPEEQLAHFLRTVPKSLIPIFEREFIRPSDLAALRAENERMEKYYYSLADAVARESDSAEHLCSIARKTRQDLALSELAVEEQIKRNSTLLQENERLTKAVEAANTLVERSKWYRLHPSIRDYIDWQEKYMKGRDA